MLKTLDRWLTAFETVCLAAGTAVAVSIATIQVFLRYFFGTGFFWAEELVVYTIVWTAFLAASAAIRSGEHLSVEIINLLARGRMSQAIVARTIAVVGVVASASLAVFGTGFVMVAHEFGQLSPALQIPMWIVYLVIPLAGVLMTIRFAQRLFGLPPSTDGLPAAENGACP